MNEWIWYSWTDIVYINIINEWMDTLFKPELVTI